MSVGSRKKRSATVSSAGVQLKASLTEFPTFIGFYVGRQDTRFLADNVELDRVFTAQHVHHRFRIYDGGHTASLWVSQAQSWVTLALSHLDRPRRRG